MVMMLNFSRSFKSFNLVRCAIFRSERMFRQRIFRLDFLRASLLSVLDGVIRLFGGPGLLGLIAIKFEVFHCYCGVSYKRKPENNSGISSNLHKCGQVPVAHHKHQLMLLSEHDIFFSLFTLLFHDESYFLKNINDDDDCDGNDNDEDFGCCT